MNTNSLYYNIHNITRRNINIFKKISYICYKVIKVPFCDGVHKMKMGKMYKFHQELKIMKKCDNILNEINEQIDCYSMYGDQLFARWCFTQ